MRGASWRRAVTRNFCALENITDACGRTRQPLQLRAHSVAEALGDAPARFASADVPKMSSCAIYTGRVTQIANALSIGRASSCNKAPLTSVRSEINRSNSDTVRGVASGAGGAGSRAGRLTMATSPLRAAEFMRRALDCERLAKITTEPLAYIELAKQWLELARQWLELAQRQTERLDRERPKQQ